MMMHEVICYICNKSDWAPGPRPDDCREYEDCEMCSTCLGNKFKFDKVLERLKSFSFASREASGYLQIAEKELYDVS